MPSSSRDAGSISVGLLTGWFSIRSSAIRHMSSIKRPMRRKEHKERKDA
jgi:hypothetical protein